MKIKYFLSAVIFLAMLALQCCDKHELTELEKLPPETQTGLYSFGCLIDGKAAVANGGSYITSDYQMGTLAIHAGLGKSGLIQLVVEDVNLTEKEYQFTDNTAGGTYARFYDGNCDFFTSTLYLGKIVITHFDKINYIISGTFEFDAHGTNCSKTVKVTDGRFDIHYAP